MQLSFTYNGHDYEVEANCEYGKQTEASPELVDVEVYKVKVDGIDLSHKLDGWFLYIVENEATMAYLEEIK